jgi:hypothetical protein
MMLTELKNVMAERNMTLTWDDALCDYSDEKGLFVRLRRREPAQTHPQEEI